MHYTVELCGFSSVGEVARQRAEIRFCSALDGALGGADHVPAFLHAYLRARDLPLDRLTQTEAEASETFKVAYEAAQMAVSKAQSLPSGAHFKVQLIL